MTQPHTSGASSRVKDLVDILLISGQTGLGAERITAALAATFEARHTHTLPPSFPDLPGEWGLPYLRMAADVGLAETTLPIALERARRFLDPLLQRSASGTWDVRNGVWSETPPSDG